jgi:hypothetical protein
MKTTVVWNVARNKRTDNKAVSTAETSVNLCETTWRNISKYSHFKNFITIKRMMATFN